MKKNIDAELEKLIGMIKGNDTIAVKLQNSLLKQVEVVRRNAKARRPAKDRVANMKSGLEKLCIVSKEMEEFSASWEPITHEIVKNNFVQWKPNDKQSRIGATRMICAYIRDNNLQNPENRRDIILDEALKTLLRYEKDVITYPHIQKYIGVHLTKE